MYDQAFKYVKSYLENHNAEMNSGNLFPFWKRSDHIKRVYMWSKRLSEGSENIDQRVLLMAAIFHDVGYAIASDLSSHAESSAIICAEYLITHGYEPKYVELVVELVRNHSNKELLKESNSTKELICLLEADLLDDNGALSIVFDCMVEGAQEEQTFNKTYGHICAFSGKAMMKNPMVTPKAITFWERKQILTKSFIEQLGYDMGSDKEFGFTE